MRAFSLSALIAGAALGIARSGTAEVPVSAPVVTVESGSLRGTADAAVIAFKGIPFAAAPIGPLRWRSPQPAPAWSGVRNASEYGHDCMQTPFPSDAAPLGTPPAEDCLYANVWKPAGKAKKWPVMVWIYGGGFVNGGASPPTYSGAALARQGILVVSFNYRVGRFGTFAHPQLTAERPDGALLGNYGYMDQLAMLRWIKRNIAAFGGDPAQVTIVGESAGGMSVHALVTSPLTSGLFSRAVAMSGGPASLGATTLASAEVTGLAFAKANGIAENDPQALAKLRALSAEQVTDGLNMAALFAPASGPKTFSSPIQDGILAIDDLAAYRAGTFAKVPMMVGATSADIGGPDGMMLGGAHMMAGLLAQQHVPTYYYRFSYVATSERPGSKGATHASDIPFFFNTAGIRYGAQATATDATAGKIASGYLVNFVKRGNPNGPGLPLWPVYAGTGAPMLDLNGTGGAAAVADSLDAAR
ncbi:carboxylesterase family protein [Sphingomonas sp. BIUV-7]|uniref:Carboxylic ester hydrolase n=1 Tax=Sphingomonas natans TaxID=3063330 RepID=A0ABT8YBP5_9SPHN|nr:carboxylesterase family protein [Sphingomonas sp. BIUV-7]MDO6415258.1 carboxylesterase family protein [Sphingomonas sp. BIUV-7]